MQWSEATAGVTGEATDSGLMISALAAASGLPSGPGLPCTGNPDLFFAEAPADLEEAKALCRGCRARINCLQGALDRREHWGVWGGELLLQGMIVPRKRPRGRPRKTDPAVTGQAAERRPRRWPWPVPRPVPRPVAEFTVRGSTAGKPAPRAWHEP
jgi:WhiB family transcriptional regulator, redox-sensing transcriptional regulator